MRRAFYLIAILGALLSMDPCFAYDLPGKPSDAIVRVCIIENKDSLALALKGHYEISARDTERVVMSGPFLSCRVSGIKDGILFGAKEVKAVGVSVKVSRDGNIYIDKRRFRGSIDIIRKDDGRLMVINRLPMDQYLYGVLYHEVSHRWPMEALKAQAIAARTFAFYQIRQSKAQLYDLRNDIYSQVYGGMTSEKWSTNTAVNRTKGQILAYKGDIFPTYYHATCGGRTEDASNLWNIDLMPLKGGSECDFCIDSPHYSWKKTIPLSLIEKKLRDKKYDIGKISKITIISKNASGRVNEIEIADSLGKTIAISGKDFRQMAGPNDIRSTKFDLTIQGGDLVVRGIGWGHGVGMCQWGAHGMSRKGWKVDKILKHYYPGAEIWTVDRVKI